ncbi:MAG: hypothetical protein II919_01060 [Lachnospiraceae bacterium]|nr:hypothetical protein [Lachnospiraceae bacterium]
MRVCPYCGEKIHEWDITCLNCGKSLVTSNTTTDVSQEQEEPEDDFGIDLFESYSKKSEKKSIDDDNESGSVPKSNDTGLLDNDNDFYDDDTTTGTNGGNDSSEILNDNSEKFGITSELAGKNDTNDNKDDADKYAGNRYTSEPVKSSNPYSGIDMFGKNKNDSDTNKYAGNRYTPEPEAAGGYNPYGGESENTGSKSKISIGDGSASDLFGGSDSGSDANKYAGNRYTPEPEAAGGYNPYGGESENTGSKSKISIGDGSASDLFGGSDSGSDANKYAGNRYTPGPEAAGGYNPYADSAPEAAGGYNPYADRAPTAPQTSSSFSQYKDNGMATEAAGGYNPYADAQNGNNSSAFKPLPSQSDANKYGTYNKKNDFTSNSNTKKVKRQQSKNKAASVIKGFIAAIIVLVAGLFLYPFIQGLAYRQYESVTKKAVQQKIEADKELFASISAFEYDRLMNDVLGPSYDRVKKSYAKNTETTKQGLIGTYGDDYKITIEIDSVSGLTGTNKQDALQKAQDDMLASFNSSTKSVTISEYIKIDEVSQAKRVQVTAKIKGNKQSVEKYYTVDLIKYDNLKDWKLLNISEN